MPDSFNPKGVKDIIPLFFAYHGCKTGVDRNGYNGVDNWGVAQ